MTVNGHFDGKVIVPDEPLDLAPNQAVTVEIHPVEEGKHARVEQALSWILEHATDSEVLPADLAESHDRYLYGRTSDK